MLADWYSPSHVVHGLLFYAFLWLAVRKMPVERRFLIALVVEVAWEIVENTPSLSEWKITAGIWALGLLIFSAGLKVALPVLSGRVLAAPSPAES